MAPSSERRYRKAGGRGSAGSAADAVDQECAEESNAAPQGKSVLKEIFPDHGKEIFPDQGSCTGKEPQQFHTILGSVPSPARAPFGTNTQPSGAPFGPPSHAPMPMVAPAVPPPPPVLPASALQEQWGQQQAVGPLLSEPGFTSYRERLRAGGRGAFQRAMHAGFLPKNMKQEWGAAQMSQAQTPGMLHPYDGQQMWSGPGQMQNNDYCSMPMAQYSQDYYGHNQMTQMSAQQMGPVSMQQQQSMQQMQMMPMPQGEQSPVQMSVPQMGMQQLQFPPMAQVQTPTASGESTPAEIENVQRECLAMIMPHAIGCDRDLLTAQLQAAAECQRYED